MSTNDTTTPAPGERDTGERPAGENLESAVSHLIRLCMQAHGRHAIDAVFGPGETERAVRAVKAALATLATAARERGVESSETTPGERILLAQLARQEAREAEAVARAKGEAAAHAQEAARLAGEVARLREVERAAVKLVAEVDSWDVLSREAAQAGRALSATLSRPAGEGNAAEKPADYWLTAPEAEVDGELRRMGLDPEEVSARGLAVVAEAMAKREAAPAPPPACPAREPGTGHACAGPRLDLPGATCAEGYHCCDCLDCPAWATPPAEEATHDLEGRPLDPTLCARYKAHGHTQPCLHCYEAGIPGGDPSCWPADPSCTGLTVATVPSAEDISKAGEMIAAARDAITGDASRPPPATVALGERVSPSQLREALGYISVKQLQARLAAARREVLGEVDAVLRRHSANYLLLRDKLMATFAADWPPGDAP